MPGEVIAILIIIGSIILFVVTFTLNRKTKVPEGIELPDKCSGCSNTLCKDKMEQKVDDINNKKINMSPDELIEYLKCEENNNGEE